jgi:predicted RNA-binding Zn ribbon-like protein
MEPTDELTHDGMPGLYGGVLCLDFVNTVDSRGTSEPGQHLRHYADLVRWGWHAGALGEPQARRLLATSARRTAAAAQTFAEAIALRETIYRIFVAIVRQGSPAPADLDRLHLAYCAALRHVRLTPAVGGYEWRWAEADTLDRVIWPIVRSAVELLTSSDVARVKECANAADCGWLFLDRSKNGSRRWCSMDDCGSRDKMRRHYARRRNARLSADDDPTEQKGGAV